MTLQLRHVTKSFGGQIALRDVDLSVAYGEVHALVGQNGSGKSTLIKVLSGYHQPEPGAEAELDGRPFQLGSTHAARAAGLRFVHQDLALVLQLSILDNMMLGRTYPVGLGGRIRWRAAADSGRRLPAPGGRGGRCPVPGRLAQHERAQRGRDRACPVGHRARAAAARARRTDGRPARRRRRPAARGDRPPPRRGPRRAAGLAPPRRGPRHRGPDHRPARRPGRGVGAEGRTSTSAG